MTRQTEELLQTRMRIDNHEVDVISLEFNSPVHLPFGTIQDRPSAWLQLQGTVDNKPAYGASEGTSLPMQIPMYDDFEGNLGNNIQVLLRPLAQRPISLGEAVRSVGLHELGGNFMTARMTVETALIDMAARGHGTSVYAALTGEHDGQELSVPYGKSIAEQSRPNIIKAAESAMANNAKRLKFKVSPENSEAIIDSLQELIKNNPDSQFMVDANGSFDPNDPEHLQVLRQIDELDLMMIEEPVSRAGDVRGLAAHVLLQQKYHFETPICLDDSVATVSDAEQALHKGLGEIINLKPGRVGSFISCLEIAELALARDRQIMVGGMYEATPGRMMTLTLAAYCLRLGCEIPGDVSLPQERLTADLVTERLQYDGSGNVAFRPRLGWGFEL
jgi:o-succinylbenzoate synthase